MVDGFDEKGAEIERDKAIARVERHCDPHWWQCMIESGKAVALRKPFFNSDDVELYRRHHFPNSSTRENRAAGPVMLALGRLGYCLPTVDVSPGRFKNHHKGNKRTWYSLIYQGPGKYRMPRRTIIDPRQFHMDLTERVHEMESEVEDAMVGY